MATNGSASTTPTARQGGAPLREIFYRLRQPARSRWPGAHRSRAGQMGFEFRAHQPLSTGGDARRIDVHASLRDPFGDWQVRLYAERVSVTVTVVADLSASMAYVGRRSKMATLAELTRALAWSTARAGDRFGFVGCGARLQTDWWLAPTRVRGAGLALADRLAAHCPAGAGAANADALLAAASCLPRQRSLVFLVSDFHLPLDLRLGNSHELAQALSRSKFARQQPGPLHLRGPLALLALLVLAAIYWPKGLSLVRAKSAWARRPHR